MENLPVAFVEKNIQIQWTKWLEEEDKPYLAPLSNKCEPKVDYYFSWQANTLTKKKTLGMIWQSLGHIWTIHVCGNGMGRLSDDCVRGTRTQPLICVGCSVHYWVSCAINKGGFFEIAFSSSTHICLAVRLTRVVIFVSSAFIFQRFSVCYSAFVKRSSFKKFAESS